MKEINRLEDLSDSHQAALANITKKGFPYMKFELEANLRRRGNFNDDTVCRNYILKAAGDEAKKALVYSRFYNDGSVDSELTFTLATDKVWLVPRIIRGFAALAAANGGEMNTEGAGFHITVLQQSTYPGGSRMPTDKIVNFTNEMTKLLPAVFFLASTDYRSRGLNMRKPQISSEDKYSAIYTHGDTCMEWRVFETCWSKPEAVFDKVEIISNALKYYSKRKNRVQFTPMPFRDSNRNIGRFFDTHETLDILNKTLPYIKPKAKTIDQLKRERRFKVDKVAIEKRFRLQMAKYQLAYVEQVDRYERMVELEIKNFKIYAQGDKQYDTVLAARDKIIDYLTRYGYIPPKPGTLEQYIHTVEAGNERSYELTPPSGRRFRQSEPALRRYQQ